MAKEDFYEKEIEKIGKFLQALISYFIKRDVAEVKEADEAKKELQKNYQIDFDNLYEMSTEELLTSLKSNSGFNHTNMDFTADLISLMGDSEEDIIRQQDYYAKALALYLDIEKTRREYDVERRKKMESIKKKMDIIRN